MRRKSSLQITLVLIGAMAVAGCGKEEGKRHVYQSKEDCLKDWGNDEKSCEEAKEGTPHYRSGSHFYYGPWYRSGTIFSGTQGSRAIRTMSISRGGFGSSSGFHSSGGS